MDIDEDNDGVELFHAIIVFIGGDRLISFIKSSGLSSGVIATIPRCRRYPQQS